MSQSFSSGQVIGEYQIEQILGSGAMGDVYRASHTVIKHIVALKVMKAQFGQDQSFRERFINEAHAIGQLNHPNIVRLLHFSVANNPPFLVMELIDGGSLRDRLQQYLQYRQVFPLAYALSMARHAAQGLAYAHQSKIIHRDIKPENMLLHNEIDPHGGRRNSILKLSDFGIARSGVMTSPGMGTGVPIGTPAYMSPEQCTMSLLDGRSDIYSLGIILYEMVAGMRPFSGSSNEEFYRKHLSEKPIPVTQIRPDLPAEVDQLILHCLEKEPQRRPDAAKLSAELTRLLGQMLPQPRRDADTTLTQFGTVLENPQSDALQSGHTTPQIRIRDQRSGLSREVELARGALLVGRQSGADIVLEGVGVSRRHLQIAWDGAATIIVTDAGSSNGTRIGDRTIAPGEPQLWQASESIMLGDYILDLVWPAIAKDDTPTGSLLAPTIADNTRQSANQGQLSTPSLSGHLAARLDIHLTEPRGGRMLVPGTPISFVARVANLGEVVDWARLEIDGVPAEWVVLDPPEAHLMPQSHGTYQQNITVTVTVPRTPSALAGIYPVVIRAHSRIAPHEQGEWRGEWAVQAFSEWQLTCDRDMARGATEAAYQLSIQNNGNAPARYQLSARDSEQALTIEFARERVELVPGAQATILAHVEAGKPPDPARSYTITFSARSDDGEIRRAVATFLHEPEAAPDKPEPQVTPVAPEPPLSIPASPARSQPPAALPQAIDSRAGQIVPGIQRQPAPMVQRTPPQAVSARTGQVASAAQRQQIVPAVSYRRMGWWWWLGWLTLPASGFIAIALLVQEATFPSPVVAILAAIAAIIIQWLLLRGRMRGAGWWFSMLLLLIPIGAITGSTEIGAILCCVGTFVMGPILARIFRQPIV